MTFETLVRLFISGINLFVVIALLVLQNAPHVPDSFGNMDEDAFRVLTIDLNDRTGIRANRNRIALS